MKDKSLGECLRHGIAFYHAALDLEDRRIVQNLFLSGHLRVVCSTSGLAMVPFSIIVSPFHGFTHSLQGVNLPAHLVVICGTKFYRSSSYVDIDSITIMQMIGRAGRPQFDSSGVAIVLTDASGDKKYRNMIEGQETIESSLHHSLAEHFNSEVVLRTIRTMEGKKEKNKAKQNKTKQNKTKQNKTKQNKTKQNKSNQKKSFCLLGEDNIKVHIIFVKTSFPFVFVSLSFFLLFVSFLSFFLSFFSL